jgi:uncharacterized protein YggE
MSRVLLVGAILFATTASPRAQVPAAEPSVIIAQGEATARRAADRAWLTISTEVREGRAGEARRKSAEAMSAVQAALTSIGLPADAIRTSGYSLQPEMGFGYTGNPGVRRYIVRNQIDVRIDDLDRLADVIDAANTARNVALTISNPRLELKSREALELDVARAAVQAAMARAQAMAAGAGQALGAVVRIQQGPVMVGLPGPPPVARPAPTFDRGGRGGAGAGTGEITTIETPFSPGELEVRAQATVTVAIR